MKRSIRIIALLAAVGLAAAAATAVRAAKAPGAKKRVKATPFAKSKAEPAGVKLAARLVLVKATYELDPALVKALAEYERKKKAGAFVPAPKPPAVDMALEIKNTGLKPISIAVGGDTCILKLELTGPGAATLASGIPMSRQLLLSRWVTLKPGAVHSIPITSLAHGLRLQGTFSYWTKPGTYKLTASYATPYAEGKPGGAPSRTRTRVTVTTAPAEVKVTKPGKAPAGGGGKSGPAEKAPKSATDFTKSKTEPAGVKLAARLVLVKATYELDPALVKALAEYERKKKKGGRRFLFLPAPPAPAVDMALEIKNVGKRRIKFLVAGDNCRLRLELEGPGAKSLRSGLPMTTEFRAGRLVTLKPGGVHSIPIKSLSYGLRNQAQRAYWTKPGKYRLTASYTTLFPDPAIERRAPRIRPAVTVTTAPAEVTVTKPGKPRRRPPRRARH